VAGLNLTRQQWQKFKEDNNLSSGSFFKKANVGPLVDAFHEAGKRWEAEDGMSSDGKKFLKAMEKLNKAFSKFIKNNEVKGQLSREAFQQIRNWMKDVGDVYDQVEDFMRLHAQNKGDKARDAQIMSKKLDKMFNF